MHITPEIWGPIVWGTLHMIALGFSDTPTYAEKRAAKEFYNSLPYLLPCPICRDHFREVLKGLPVENWLDNRKSLVDWTWSVHNQVNIRLGKPEVTKDAFFKAYSDMSERGIPVPPASQTAGISDSALTEAYTRGATVATGVIVTASFVGCLMWFSYKGKS